MSQALQVVQSLTFGQPLAVWLLGLALPDDNPHSPNEKFDLDCFAAGMRLGAYLWQELAAD